MYRQDRGANNDWGFSVKNTYGGNDTVDLGEAWSWLETLSKKDEDARRAVEEALFSASLEQPAAKRKRGD